MRMQAETMIPSPLTKQCNAQKVCFLMATVKVSSS